MPYFNFKCVPEDNNTFRLIPTKCKAIVEHTLCLVLVAIESTALDPGACKHARRPLLHALFKTASNMFCRDN